MVVTAKVKKGEGFVGDIRDYSVTEEATPLLAGDSSGGVGQINIAAKGNADGPLSERSPASVGSELTFNDPGVPDLGIAPRGELKATITKASMPGDLLNISAETVDRRFNVDRTAMPFFGSFVPARTMVTQRTNLATNPGRETNLTNVAFVTVGGGAGTLTRPTDGGFQGDGYASATWTTNATGPGGGIQDTVPIPAVDLSYTFSIYARVGRGGAIGSDGVPAQRLKLMITWMTSADFPIAVISTDFAPLPGTWQQAVISGVAPPATTKAIVSVVSTTGTYYSHWLAGNTLDTDALLVEQGGYGPYFSGNTSASTEVDPTTGYNVVRTHAWTGTANASTSTETVTTEVTPHGVNATQGNYFRYLCELVGLPAPYVEPRFDGPQVAYPGWTGNVFNYLKDFLIAIQGEVAVVDGTVMLRSPRRTKIPTESITNAVLSVNSTLSAQFVTIYNYNSLWGIDRLAWSAESQLSVTTGERLITEISFPHFLTSINTPICVDKWNEEYQTGQGQYAVLDSQGLVVSSNWWNKNGGRLVVELAYDNPNAATVTVIAPPFDGDGYVGPWKLARETEDSTALDITGTGVFIDKQLKRLRTGAQPEETSVVDAPAIDNVFLSNPSIAISRGMDAACAAAGPVVTLSGELSRSVYQKFGMVAGGRIWYRDNVFRITDVTYSNLGISFNATADMTFTDLVDIFSYTFEEFNNLYPSLTFSQFDTLQAGKTFKQFDAGFGNPTFDMFNTVHADSRFRDFAIYPAVKTAPVETFIY